ncbi:rhodanese-like domain-containing protein [Pseudorhodobacter sp. E13]|uniref:rhodanese-like domain-containing protein n=1 Tax=Pseudorhodobacter sp. E13 TaxID=2487931 RepID=UPI000F8F4E36|nr:rhodanese-like domain-containing protein [Pseudorhodobacter sp. E13]RUS59963.1 rhodanese-like domain-containing protein [Pseudorhodobacter sp. E13]
MSIWGYVLGAAVVLGAVLFGLANLTQTAAAQNVMLEPLTGQALASDDSLFLVDIRTPEEWKQSGVVEGALLLTYSTPEAFLQVVAPKLKPGQRIGLICRSGNRTSRAAQQIAPLFKGEIVDVQGGMNRVLVQGYQPVKPTRMQGCASC